MLLLPPRHGKACAHDTPVPTPLGWTTHGELKPGDEVFGPDGATATVLALSADVQMVVPVRLSNGEVIRCHPNHEWTVLDRRRHAWRTLETRELATDLWIGEQGSRGSRCRFQLPLTSAVEYPAAEQIVHPYALGAWLGDGSEGSTIIAHDPRDAEVIVGVEACGYSVTGRRLQAETGVAYAWFSGPRPGVGSELQKGLKALGVLRCKHIPESYLRASLEQRLEIMAGLVDTDGSVEPQTGRVRFSTCSTALRDGVFDLAVGLGFRPYVVIAEPCVSSSGIVGRKQVFQVCFQPTMPIPVRIPRKALERFAPQRRVSIVNIGDSEDASARSICIDRDDGLYLVGRRMVATHNTELASRRYPPWNLGRNPHRQIIAASATESFATDVGREVRNIIRTEEFGDVFPGVSLASDSTAAGRWHTNHGGVFAAVGVGSQILGKGADDFIIDDPFATMADAQSEVQRKAVIAWYQGSVYNRLQPGGTIVLINHRMHEEDLSGYLIDRQNFDGDKWEIVSLPAITDGEALWPEAYPIEALERIKANTLPRFWSGLYQQNPQPEDGTFFQRAWFKEWTVKPKLNIYGTSDYAVTDSGGDYTVHRVWGVDHAGNIYRLDGWRGQTSSDVWIEEKLDLIAKWKPYAWFGEGGVIHKAIEPMLLRRMNERKIFCRLEWMPSLRDKPTRARGFQARAAMGKVFMEPGADLSEFLMFPAGKHDDEIDCVSAGTFITMADGARKLVEDVTLGEYVLTPLGCGRVSAARCTIRDAAVMRLRLSSGEELVATPNHPIATKTGFVRLDALSIGGSATTEADRCQSVSFSTGGRIAGIQTASIAITAIISKLAAARGFFTVTFGRMRTGRYRAVCRSIISTATQATTSLKTWPALARRNTVPSIPCRRKAINGNSLISPIYAIWQPIGIDRQRGENGTLNTQSALRPVGRNANVFASAAPPVLLRNIAGLLTFVHRLAVSASRFAGLTLTMRLQRALRLSAVFVADCFAGKTRSRRYFAARNVSVVIGLDALERRENVYNLTVEGENVFYANGILTHNCASILGRALDQAHPAIIPIIEPLTTPSDYRPAANPDADGSPWG